MSDTNLRFELNADEKKELLLLARQTVESYVTDRKIPAHETQNQKLLTECGAFVTLHKHGELRGCIGYVEAYKPLYQTIIDMAVAASTKDPRFEPVSKKELKELHIEISVLSPLEKIDDFSKIIIGVHGLIIKKGFRSGILLPQVAVEWNMDVTTFLEETCRKAGLPRDSYKEGAEVYYFSAQVFSEEK